MGNPPPAPSLNGEEFSVEIDEMPPGESGYDFDDYSAEDVTPVEPIIKAPDKQQKTTNAKSGIPTVEEWQDFIGRFVVRGITRGYLSIILRDIEEDLTDYEREQIQLSGEDLADIAKPIAEFANKNKFARKHGRQIISAAGSSESFIALAIWMRRVNKIAKRHRADRPRTVRGHVVPQEGAGNGYSGPDDGQGSGQQGTGYDFFNPGTG